MAGIPCTHQGGTYNTDIQVPPDTDVPSKVTLLQLHFLDAHPVAAGSNQRNNSGQRSEKKEGNENKTGCFRCGKTDHLAKQYPTYKDRSTSKCRDCRLDHPTGECRNRRQSNHLEVKKEEEDQT